MWLQKIPRWGTFHLTEKCVIFCKFLSGSVGGSSQFPYPHKRPISIFFSFNHQLVLKSGCMLTEKFWWHQSDGVSYISSSVCYVFNTLTGLSGSLQLLSFYLFSFHSKKKIGSWLSSGELEDYIFYVWHWHYCCEWKGSLKSKVQFISLTEHNTLLGEM